MTSMRKLDTIQKEHMLNHAYATDTPDKSGACHFYTVMDSEDKLIMGYIRFQQGVREGNLPVGLRDDDLLEIVRDNLCGVIRPGTRFLFVKPDPLSGAEGAAAMAICKDLETYVEL